MDRSHGAVGKVTSVQHLTAIFSLTASQVFAINAQLIHVVRGEDVNRPFLELLYPD
jgi:hypothetical protein